MNSWLLIYATIYVVKLPTRAIPTIQNVDINIFVPVSPFNIRMQKIILIRICIKLELISKISFQEKIDIEMVDISHVVQKPIYRKGALTLNPKYRTRNSRIRKASSAFTAISKIKFIISSSLCNS